jgi:hypothetical protein
MRTSFSSKWQVFPLNFDADEGRAMENEAFARRFKHFWGIAK